ncbi:MAG: peptide chain release factor 3 [Eubacteriales bacterium]|nr:peptide chain release factor 3 [Eubacteriales bacterium]
MPMKPAPTDEILRRRTFAIISHPDAGKTTLTEKLLLYGGAIHLAGSVKARKASRHAVSDWMEIEKQRGISVTSSAMQFDYEGYRINILDTPGHQDFSEDTYRTLMAADSAVMLIDGARGVEPQTIKLFHVCRMRGIPIFTFVNKMDRAAKDPFALMSEIEDVLGIHCCPMNWPIGTDGDFQGIYNRETRQVELFSGDESHGAKAIEATQGILEEESIRQRLGEYHTKRLQDDLELLDGAGEELDRERIAQGQLSPMFFGSAMNNFGVESFLGYFLQMAPSPAPRKADTGLIEPEDPRFSAFVFKIQANMNPAHRDRLAFIRVCSGVFEKGMSATVAQSGQSVRMAQPQQFMANEREMVEQAYPGDIIGLFDPGVFHLGDTLTDGSKFCYEGIPMFASESFMRVSTLDSMKRKQFVKGVNQLAEEGAIQVFKQVDIGRQELIIGVVGVLQFDVFAYRIKGEYGVDIRMESLPYRYVRWVTDYQGELERIAVTSSTLHAADAAGRPVLLFSNDWSIQWALDNNKGLALSDTASRVWDVED